jgi:hypothetical protein
VCMFCGRAGHLDEFCFLRKRIERRRVEYARDPYRDEFIDFPPRSYSRVMPRFTLVFCLTLLLVLRLSSLMDPTIAHMVLVHERTALSLDALVKAHVLIVVIISCVGLVFPLEVPLPTLSRDTWTVHAFSVVVHVPLDQVVRCKGQ